MMESSIDDYLTCPQCGYSIFLGSSSESSGYSHTTSYYHRRDFHPEAKPTKPSNFIYRLLVLEKKEAQDESY